MQGVLSLLIQGDAFSHKAWNIFIGSEKILASLSCNCIEAQLSLGSRGNKRKEACSLRRSGWESRACRQRLLEHWWVEGSRGPKSNGCKHEEGQL